MASKDLGKRPATPRNSAQILASIEKLLKYQNDKLERIDRKLADIKLRLGANY